MDQVEAFKEVIDTFDVNSSVPDLRFCCRPNLSPLILVSTLGKGIKFDFRKCFSLRYFLWIFRLEIESLTCQRRYLRIQNNKVDFISLIASTKNRLAEVITLRTYLEALQAAKSPKWRRGSKQMAKLAIFNKTTFLALYNVRYIMLSRKKSQKFYSLPAIKK